MDLSTKDLLINFLFILLPLFIVQMFYLVKYAYRLEEVKEWMLSIFPILSLVLCMLFPVAVGENFVWDLRWIPFILGGLYGGYRLGYFLLFLILIIRYIMGYNGFYIPCIAFPILLVIVLALSKSYLQMSVKRKVVVSSGLIFLGILLYGFVAIQFFGLNVERSIWIQFIVIQVVGMLITTLLWEVILANFQVLQKLVKAEKIQMVGHLAASISHEVRNPLAVSRGFIQMLSENISVQQRKQYADIALQELDRATEVINDYLTFAKPTIEKKEKINISEEIQYAVNVIVPLANMNGVQVKLSLLKADGYFVCGERKKFQQCLINILKNGIESMPNNGALAVDLSHSRSIIQIHIQDEGMGMTQEQINRLGEPYFTTKEKGTGLGMMVAYSIVKGMDGNISVASELGKGTCFSLKLPIYSSS